MKIIFNRAGLKKENYTKLMSCRKIRSRFNIIKPKQTIYLLINNHSNNLEKLIYPINRLQYFKIFYDKNKPQTELIKLKAKKELKAVSGTIQQSLSAAALHCGLSKALTSQLIHIFSDRINFKRDIHKGDQFKLLYEEYSLHNKKIRTGNIIAAAFIINGKLYQAIRYQDDYGIENYYTPRGKSLSFSLVRKPLKYKRISSPFHEKRKHPILGIVRAHKGVDFAAPTGTPIKAAGNGKVIFRGRHGGYGNIIIIKHNRKYKTLYAHLSRFAKNVRARSRVKKGQIIGYVGQSGLATGPHLHYEIRINGKCYDPLTVKLPSAAPISKKELPVFLAYAKKMLDALHKAS